MWKSAPDSTARSSAPFSAKNLPETQAEKDGLVDREQLLDLFGRSRKPQMALAEEFGVTDYPSPAGGCLLTEVNFGKRLKDLFAHDENATPADCELLKGGRHFRLTETAKLVIGRTGGTTSASTRGSIPSDTSVSRRKTCRAPWPFFPAWQIPIP